MSLDQWLLVLLLLAIPLLQRIVITVRRRRQAAGDPRTAAFEASAPPPLRAPFPAGIGGSAGRGAMVPPIPARASVAGGHRGRIPNVIRASTPLRVALAGKDVRIALVHMAILGPCRALEPRDPSPAT